MKKALNYIKILMVCVIALTSFSCTNYSDEFKDVPYIKHFYFTFSNESSHTILCSNSLATWELKPNQSLLRIFSAYSFEDIILYDPTFMEDIPHLEDVQHILFKGSTTLFFDNTFAIEQTENTPHSLLDISSYESENLANSKFVYTFTDADYDYAVEHGVNLDEPTE